MSELIERLRKTANALPPPAPAPPHPLYSLIHEAAYEIGRLEVAVAHLEAEKDWLIEELIRAKHAALTSAL